MRPALSVALLVLALTAGGGELFDFEAGIDWRATFPRLAPLAVFKYEQANAGEGLDLALENDGAAVVGFCRAERPWTDLADLAPAGMNSRVLPVCPSVLHQWNVAFTGPYEWWLTGELAGEWRLFVAGPTVSDHLPRPAQETVLRQLHAGRGWLWVGGRGNSVDLLERSAGVFLPEPRQRADGAVACRLTAAGQTHPLTAGFDAAGLDGPLPRLQVVPDPEATVLLEVNGEPLLAVRSVGTGRVLGIAWDGSDRGGWLLPGGLDAEGEFAARALLRRAAAWAAKAPIGPGGRYEQPPAMVEAAPAAFRVAIRRPSWLDVPAPPRGEKIVEQAWNGEVTWHRDRLAPVVEVPHTVWSPWAWQVLPYWACFHGAEVLVLPAAPGLLRPTGAFGEAGHRWARATQALPAIAIAWSRAEPVPGDGPVVRRRLGDAWLFGAVNGPDLPLATPLSVDLDTPMHLYDQLTGRYLGHSSRVVLALEREPVAAVAALPARLESFTARRDGDGVRLRWRFADGRERPGGAAVYSWQDDVPHCVWRGAAPATGPIPDTPALEALDGLTGTRTEARAMGNSQQPDTRATGP